MSKTGHASPAPKLLQRVRLELRARHYSPRTEQAYVLWTRRFVRFHGMRHPDSMGEQEIRGFLTHLAVERRVSSSTQNQALSALLFLFDKVLDRRLRDLGSFVRARTSRRLPVVLTRGEVRDVLRHMTGDTGLMAQLMYGSGLRLSECLSLRVQHVDFGGRTILVREGRGREIDRPCCPLHSSNHSVPTSRGFERYTGVTSRTASAGWLSPMPWPGSMRVLRWSGDGNGSSRSVTAGATERPRRRDATIAIPRSSSGP